MLKYEEIKKEYDASNPWGLSCSIDVSECDPKIIRSQILIKRYVKDLCNLIKMKRFSETRIIHFGDEERVAGYSMMQFIETSLISGHFANLTNNAYIDLFSCKLYNPYEAAEFTEEFFKGKLKPVQVTFRY